MTPLKCWNCGASLAELPRPITRHMNCPGCFEDLHCCRMCRHFIDSATNPCADERAEPPVYKEGANFCDFFRPASESYRAGANERRARAKSTLDALFSAGAAQDEEGGGEAADEADQAPPPQDERSEARRKLDDLFR